ncbi:hypothetical protein AVEN_157893-1 [Araneus ventricosus]|uniref:Uncharacterized protein n=1 Tax=Araneus ventricosus TaxID=182803 RepID=A0A4Y2R1P2_ARAVE|nr:hypothetical protein AVEN_157893-1 [Araneus ventricosus]
MVFPSYSLCYPISPHESSTLRKPVNSTRKLRMNMETCQLAHDAEGWVANLIQFPSFHAILNVSGRLVNAGGDGRFEVRRGGLWCSLARHLLRGLE